MRIILFLCGILLIASSLHGQNIDPPFNLNDAIRQVTRNSGSENDNIDNKWVSNGNHYSGHRSGEFLIDTSITYVPAVDHQFHPSLAFDGTNYLVVWDDDRYDNNDIYCTRLDISGNVLDHGGIYITYRASHPEVSFDGSNYLVVYVRDGNIYGIQVSPTGVLIGSQFTICSWWNAQHCPSISFDGTNFLVAWQDERNGNNDIYGTRVNQSGIVIDSAGIPISIDSTSQKNPSIAFDGTNFLIAWPDNRNGDDDIYCARVNQSGIVLDTTGIPISTEENSQCFPSVLFDSTNYLIVWNDKRNGNEDIYCARVSQSGIVLDTTGILISTMLAWMAAPAVSFNGTNYQIVWEAGYNIYGARVSTSGIVLDTSGILISTMVNQQTVPAVSFNGTNYLIVWEDSRGGDANADIYGMRVNQAGLILDTVSIAISTAPNPQKYPAVISYGTNYFVVWEDSRSGDRAIYGTRIDQNGNVLDTAGILITDIRVFPKGLAIAFDGINFMVVWPLWAGDVTILYGSRVDQSGVVLDTSGIYIAYNAAYASIAFAGTNYLVVWQKWNYGGHHDIFGARIDQNGIVLDPEGILISAIGRGKWYPSVSSDGKNYFVAWSDYRNSLLYTDIYGARVNRQSGQVLDSLGIPICTYSKSQY